jgi:Ca2+-binding RTX toxin-like protein
VLGEDGDDILFGDHGEVVFDGGVAVTIRSLAEALGANDVIVGSTGNDIAVGGAGADDIQGNEDNDVLLGDNGQIARPGGVLSSIVTTAPNIGGDDTIQGNAGDDDILGGSGNDNIAGQDGNDVLIGDNGAILFQAGVVSDVHTTDPTFGGNDTISGGDGADIALGGVGSDSISGAGGNDILLGDNGHVLFVAGALSEVATTDPANGAADVITGDDGNDIALGGTGNDTIDGGSGQDLLLGDHGRLQFTSGGDPRIRALTGTTLYDANLNAAVGPTFQANPIGVPIPIVTLFDLSAAAPDAATYGNDNLAGGTGNDMLFGQLGNDLLCGDGTTASPVSADPTQDGDDYIEGNAGNDTIYGGLGQDDLIGGSSNLFGLTSPSQRADGGDVIFGGNGTAIARNDAGDLSAAGHARDADVIVGDNGNIYRIVGTNGVVTGSFLSFNYDNYGAAKIVVRAVQYLDYVRGGSATDIGGNDVIHGEAGDDQIHGMAGNDVLFGEGQDDDISGGAGSDRIYGGTGEDGILGDDGVMRVSRDGLTEPLYGITTVNAQAEIDLPGPFTGAWIYITGRLNKTPSFGSTFPQGGNDTIYGGLGDDFLHGGAGDDSISGAEAQAAFYNDAPVTNTNPLGYDPVTRKLAAYDATNPFARIAGFPLNFDAVDGQGNKINDGKDRLFGDEGNDWLVGGTQNDRLFGGMGDDLLNADDNLDTNGGANDQPDAPVFADRDFAFGGGGLDVLIANTGGDRLFDWTGEFNSYLVPFSPFGEPTINRDPSPHVVDFLRGLGQESGTDQALSEPSGELGLVTQQDPQFGDQHGGPRDPQPGHTHASRDTRGGPEDDRNTALPLAGTAATAAPSTSSGADAVLNQVFVGQDPADTGQLVLFVGGTKASDTIDVRAGSTSNKVRVIINGVDRGEFDRTSSAGTIGKVIVYANDGNDTVTINSNLGTGLKAILYGDAGDDTLTGGAGANFMDGGDGNDHLFGNSGRDILVGGDGADTLSGDQESDILIGSSYSDSEDLAAVDAVMSAWGTSETDTVRIAKLKAGVGAGNLYALNSSTVLADAFADVLNGGQQQDWFWTFASDTTDRKGTETTN